jgi:hypothetical protein
VFEIKYKFALEKQLNLEFSTNIKRTL